MPIVQLAHGQPELAVVAADLVVEVDDFAQRLRVPHQEPLDVVHHGVRSVELDVILER